MAIGATGLCPCPRATRRRRGLTAVLLAILAVAGASLAGPPRAEAAFCKTGVVHNYQKPLEDMPPLRGVPPTNDLPFGPAGLFIGERATGAVVAGKTVAGFSLSFGSLPARPTARLDWTVVTRLVRVARRERVKRLIQKRVAQVTRMEPGEMRRFWFRIPGKPSLYRLEIEFRNRAGRRIGRFGRYLRVLGHSRNARIALPGTSFPPGTTVSPRLENYGTESLLYGLAYAIELYDGANWVRSPAFPPRPVPLIGLRTGPGETASCWKFTIPQDAPPGLYRFVLSGRTSKGTIPGRNAPIAITAQFRILPAAG